MANNENYQKDPGPKLEAILQACQWEQVGPGLWEKGCSRLSVDNVGIFLYRRFLEGFLWVRTFGLSHNRITHLSKRIIHFDGDHLLDLTTGE